MSAHPSRSTPLAPLRTLLSSIITSIAATQPTPSVPLPTRHGGTHPSQSSSRQPLLAVLHVLYPAIVLPALDLLDRRLVTKVILGPKPRSSTEPEIAGPIPEAIVGTGEVGNSFYLVHSAQSTRPRRGVGADGVSEPGLGKSYVVRLEAWNCTCAAFTFSAFPASRPPFSSRDFGGRSGLPLDAGSWRQARNQGRGGVEDRWYQSSRGAEGEETRDWEMGGLSNDGCDGGVVPCCKHLMACLLVERDGGPRDGGGWEGYFGNGVAVKWVGREEMAGLEAE